MMEELYDCKPVFYYSSEDSEEVESSEHEETPKPEIEFISNLKKLIEKDCEIVDDACPGCFRGGYTKNKKPECDICKCSTCFNCSYDHIELGHICYIHRIKKGKYKGMNLEEKIYMYIKKDEHQYGITGDIDLEFVCDQLNKQKGRCYICKDFVLQKHSMGCKYQISIDRISNLRPHNKENCVVSCNYCNCRKYAEKVCEKDYKKICDHGCHSESRELPRKKDVIFRLTGVKVGGYEFW